MRDLLADLQKSVPALVLLSGPTAAYIGIGRAVDVARWLAANGYVILGMEGFRCDGTSVLSLTDFIADFSSVADAGSGRLQLSLEAATTVLANWHDGVTFIDFAIEAI